MNKLHLKIFGAVAVLAIVGAIVWLVMRPSKDSCEYYEYVEASDRFLTPYLAEPTEVKWYPNYYKCNKPQKGDIVWYALGNPPQNYFRILAAVEDDEIHLVPDRDSRGWNLIVNDQMLMTNDMPYFFGVPKKQTTLSIYLKNNMKKLGANEIVMFSTNPPGFNDSGIFGMYSLDSMKGKIVLPKEQNITYTEYVSRMYSEEVAKTYFANPPKDFNKAPEPAKPVGLVPVAKAGANEKSESEKAAASAQSDEDLVFNDKEEKPEAKPTKKATPKGKAADKGKSAVKGKTPAKLKAPAKPNPKGKK